MKPSHTIAISIAHITHQDLRNYKAGSARWWENRARTLHTLQNSQNSLSYTRRYHHQPINPSLRKHRLVADTPDKLLRVSMKLKAVGTFYDFQI